MRIHFIAIGGAAMHSLAIALQKIGHQVSGSDDDVFEPSRSRLKKHHLLPEQMGWNAQRITQDIDAIILGMHAKKDNPELLKAQELGIKVYSYPEFIYEQSRNKTRVVIGGSHGKTSITAMVMHVLKYHQYPFDYMVGSQLNGFDNMAQLSEEAPCIILEGDEYLSSPINLVSKFHWYRPQIALLSGIAWDHINVFPTFESYLDTFKTFIASLPEDAYLTFFTEDKHLKEICKPQSNQHFEAYNTHPFKIENGQSYLIDSNQHTHPIQIFGEHNLQNLSGALNIVKQLGLSAKEFYEAIGSFQGTAKRLELIKKEGDTHIFLDFAHAPSKLKATVKSVKQQFPNQKLYACMELHTFSSLRPEFLPQYHSCMNEADEAVIFFNPEVAAKKSEQPITEKEIIKAFGKDGLRVINDTELFKQYCLNLNLQNANLLLMSSGNFGGLNIRELMK